MQSFSFFSPVRITKDDACSLVESLAREWSERREAIPDEEIASRLVMIHNGESFTLWDTFDSALTFKAMDDGSVEFVISHDEPRDA